MEKSLIETNPYLRDPDERRRLILRSAWDSSVFSGAQLKPLEHYMEELEREIQRGHTAVKTSQSEE